MTELVGVAGALLLGAAIVPQAIELAKSRRADGLHFGFIALNVAGLALLAVRSAELQEWAFVAVNLAGGLFWLAAFLVKALGLELGKSSKPAPPPA